MNESLAPKDPPIPAFSGPGRKVTAMLQHKRITINYGGADGQIITELNVEDLAKSHRAKELVEGLFLHAQRIPIVHHQRFQRRFMLGEGEFRLQTYSCALEDGLLKHGKLYLSENYICFASPLFKRKLKILWKNVVGIHKRHDPVTKMIPNAIEVVVRSASSMTLLRSCVVQRHRFASFLFRDSTYELMSALWRSKIEGADLALDEDQDNESDCNSSVEDRPDDDADFRHRANTLAPSHSAASTPSASISSSVGPPFPLASDARRRSVGLQFHGVCRDTPLTGKWRLKVCIVEGRDVTFDPRVGAMLTSNRVYASVSVEQSVVVTNHVHWKEGPTCDPVWNEEFIFDVEDPNSAVIDIKVVARTNGPVAMRRSCGHVSVPLSTVPCYSHHSILDPREADTPPSPSTQFELAGTQPLPSIRESPLRDSSTDIHEINAPVASRENGDRRPSLAVAVVSSLLGHIPQYGAPADDSSDSEEGSSDEKASHIVTGPQWVTLTPRTDSHPSRGDVRILLALLPAPVETTQVENGVIDVEKRAPFTEDDPSTNTDDDWEVVDVPVPLENTLQTVTFSKTVGELRNIMFGNENSFLKAFFKRMSYTDASIPEWTKDDDANETRLVEYTMPPSALIKSTKAYEKQTIVVGGFSAKKARLCVMEVETTTPDVPFGKSFNVGIQYCITAGEDGSPNSSTLRISVQVNFTGSVMSLMKSSIRKGALEGTTKAYKEYVEALESFIKSGAAEGASVPLPAISAPVGMSTSTAVAAVPPPPAGLASTDPVVKALILCVLLLLLIVASLHLQIRALQESIAGQQLALADLVAALARMTERQQLMGCEVAGCE
eukprot:Rmarinus@m.10083